MATPRNEGEGNKTADRNYREATQEFVESERGQREIQNAGNLPTPQPTLYLHGTDDGCIGTEALATAADFLPHPSSRIELVEGAGHFMQVERPDHVNRLIVDFLAE